MQNETREDIGIFIGEMCAKYGGDKTGFVMKVLSDVLDRYRYIPVEALEELAQRTEYPLRLLQKICDRSEMFSTERVGEHLIMLCDGTVCHTKGAVELLQALGFALGIKAGETTEDGRFTLRVVSCVGSCSCAPVMTVDGEPFGQMKLADVSKALETL